MLPLSVEASRVTEPRLLLPAKVTGSGLVMAAFKAKMTWKRAPANPRWTYRESRRIALFVIAAWPPLFYLTLLNSGKRGASRWQKKESIFPVHRHISIDDYLKRPFSLPTQENIYDVGHRREPSSHKKFSLP